jgi:hypothetical protein
VPRSHSNKK